MSRNFEFTGSLQITINSLEAGMYLLRAKPMQAFSLFSEACARVKTLLLEQPFLLLQHIIAGFQPSKWSSQTTRISILSFVTSMAAKVLGNRHPLTLITRLLLHESTIQKLPSRFLKLLSDVTSQAFRSDDERFLRLQLRIAEEHAYYGHLESAQIACHSLVARATEVLGPHHLITRRAHRRIGVFSWQQGNWDDAKRVLLQSLELTMELEESPIATRTGISTCRYLGYVYRDTHDYPKSEKYLRLALQGWKFYANWKEGDMIRTLDDLENVLSMQGKTAELTELQFVWQR
jgi:tetratricopeptide (TPR) repeat protein